MPTLDCFGTVVNLDEDGYLEDGESWTPEVAETLARRVGIARMTDRHWKVIAQCREEAARGGEPLDPGRIAALTGTTVVELDRLFPGGLENTVARIAGLPRSDPPAHAKCEPQEVES